MKKWLALAFLGGLVCAESARAATTLPVGIEKWGLPAARDLEMDKDALSAMDAGDSDLPALLEERARATGEGTGPSRDWWNPSVTSPYWVAPSVTLPDDVKLMRANNNVGIEFHDGRLYMAWRTAPTHFASAKTRMYLVSSADYGRSWQTENVIALGSDVREPCFLSYKGRLIFSFFESGTNPIAFEPKSLWRMERLGQGQWTKPEKWGDKGEIAWEIKVRNGKAYASTYKGSHYSTGTSKIDVYFKESDDGWNWRDLNPMQPAVYTGGASEAGWEFDAEGNLWSVMRNEDGDKTGFGSQITKAKASQLWLWDPLKKSDRKRYDSPRMFRHGEDVYMVARRDVGGPFDRGWNWMNFTLRKYLYWIGYSFRAKRTALYWLDRTNKKVVWLRDLPGDGDTAFPSVVQTGPHSWLVANYTSPLGYPRRTWLWGQISPQGTQIYFTEISFKGAK